MSNTFGLLLFLFAFCGAVHGRELHVSLSGKDSNPGDSPSPLRTIQHAANLAQPGDVITVHKGIYRERIAPPRGGTSDDRRIVYQAAPGDTVDIRGSEVIRNWQQVRDHIWMVTLPNSMFGSFNPYGDVIHGDWFDPCGRVHHTGAVYLNGDWLTEAAAKEDVLKPQGEIALWFAKVDAQQTTIWAQFGKANPNDQLVEINVRQTVFYPEKEGINYLTVRGFKMRHAATPWAPPTAEQVGLVGTHWSKGWIIEDNEISHSVCSGISLGKYGDEFDNKSQDTAEGYVQTIERALKHGWNGQTIGHHIVRRNHISHCEQAGVVGSLGAIFSTITENTIHDIHVRKLFSGAEMAAIKIHAAVDVQITRNHIHHTRRAVWLDWMAQGTRVSRNLMHDNEEDLFIEVDHGPYLVDNNLFLSTLSLVNVSRGGAYAHNLFAGKFVIAEYDPRQTPYLKPHDTAIAGFHDNPRGDDRYNNNIFVERCDLSAYNTTKLPVWMDGNVFVGEAKPATADTSAFTRPAADFQFKLLERADGCYLELSLGRDWSGNRGRKLVTSQQLGKAVIPNLPYEQPDGSAIKLDLDYFGKPRSDEKPTPGPFEMQENPTGFLKVW